jgi:hypothetical protein
MRLCQIRTFAAVFGCLNLAACATTARMHTEAELSAVGRACGAAEGEVIQDAEEPRVLVFYAVAPSRAEIHCLAKWARHRHLHLAYISAVDQKSQ